jgi:hypothetical protein
MLQFAHRRIKELHLRSGDDRSFTQERPLMGADILN